MSQSLEAVFGLLVKRSFSRSKQRSFGSYWNYVFCIYSVLSSYVLDSASASTLSIPRIWVTAIQLFLRLTHSHISRTIVSNFTDLVLPLLQMAATIDELSIFKKMCIFCVLLAYYMKSK